MFNYQTDFDNENDFSSVTHLRDFADSLDLDTSAAFGLSAEMDAEQLASVRHELQEAIDAKLAELNALPSCHLGPYANNICTICGGREPSAS